MGILATLVIGSIAAPSVAPDDVPNDTCAGALTAI
jgi:hypothetical protein